MANNNRTVANVLKGIWTHSLSIIAQFTFPAQITTTLHRMRGVHVGKGSKINKEEKITIIMVSHDMEAAKMYASHILHIGGEKCVFCTKQEFIKENGGCLF